jgi:O-acetyl-ADP-ribose deacetylase (regulator of RNase III)
VITVKQGDIVKEDVEVIVNAANTRLAGGGGVDGAIHRAAGPSVLEECRRIGGCPTGEAVMTGAGELPARKIIHTPGPVWRGGGHGEEKLLRSCYEKSLALARESGFGTIAFPAISTGVYGYPIEKAASVALAAGRKFEKDFDEIRYVCFSRRDLEVYRKAFEKLKKTGS